MSRVNGLGAHGTGAESGAKFTPDLPETYREIRKLPSCCREVTNKQRMAQNIDTKTTNLENIDTILCQY